MNRVLADPAATELLSQALAWSLNTSAGFTRGDLLELVATLYLAQPATAPVTQISAPCTDGEHTAPTRDALITEVEKLRLLRDELQERLDAAERDLDATALRLNRVQPLSQHLAVFDALEGSPELKTIFFGKNQSKTLDLAYFLHRMTNKQVVENTARLVARKGNQVSSQDLETLEILVKACNNANDMPVFETLTPDTGSAFNQNKMQQIDNNPPGSTVLKVFTPCVMRLSDDEVIVKALVSTR